MTTKKKQDFSKVEFITYNEGLCVQCMHIEAYDDEPAAVEALHRYMEGQGYVLDITDQRMHHEIYLSDARKVPPEKQKEIEILYISLFLSMIGTVAAGIDTHNQALNMAVGLFLYTAPTQGTSTFAFCNWYLFVAVGLVVVSFLLARLYKSWKAKYISDLKAC